MSEPGSGSQEIYKLSSTNMAFIPIRYTRPQLQVPVLCSRRLYIHLAMLVLTVIILIVIRVMTQVKVTFVHYHMESDSDAERVTLPMSFSSARGAYCLDGSSPAYYYRPSPTTAVNFWLIYLPGGSWCTSAEDCFQRSLTELGSSYVARTSLSYDGILSKDCDKNPDFCLWNVIIMLYCDGGSFLGNVSNVLTYESQPLYMRGAVVFDALMEYLLTATHLDSAEQIVLAGSSAGAVGAFIHADRLRSRLPKSVKTLHVLADAALFVDVPSSSGQHVAAETFQSVYTFHSMKSSVSIQECTQTQQPEDEWKCLLPEVYHRFVFTPLFFINSVYDSWQRTNMLKISCSAITCPSIHIDTVYKLRDAIQNVAHQITQSRKNGVFITTCPLHVLIVKPWFSKLDLGNPTLQRSVATWLQHDEEQRNINANIDLEQALEKCKNVLNYSNSIMLH